MKNTDRSGVISVRDSDASVRALTDGHAVSVLQRGTLHAKFSLPAEPNLQTPHTQDEIYVIVRGSGWLAHDGRRDRFAAGDLVFVAAGVEHRFEDFSDDLAIWVIFYGRDGGEIAHPGTLR
jgi:mannose-6-phosphate isomerase-like protein (cupin superfamily)